MKRTPMSGTRYTRRRALALGGAGLAAPSLARAQSVAEGMTFFKETGLVRFEEACRALTGFDPLPRPLLMGLFEALGPELAGAVAEGGGALDRDTEARVVRALYTGVLPAQSEEGAPRRIVYADALMHAAAEGTLNVPTYCGGLPNFWQEPPEDRA
jgi:hypothetical protein